MKTKNDQRPVLFGGRAKRASLSPAEAAARLAAQQVAHKARYRQLAREITEIPPVVNPQRRAAGEKSLQTFLRTYFPNRFYLDWSPDHLTAISKIEEALLDGALYALAMPRGRGKTTICEGGEIWGALNGYQPFPLLIGATSKLATDMLSSIKSELLENDLLYEAQLRLLPLKRLQRPMTISRPQSQRQRTFDPGSCSITARRENRWPALTERVRRFRR